MGMYDDFFPPADQKIRDWLLEAMTEVRKTYADGSRDAATLDLLMNYLNKHGVSKFCEIANDIWDVKDRMNSDMLLHFTDLRKEFQKSEAGQDFVALINDTVKFSRRHLVFRAVPVAAFAAAFASAGIGIEKSRKACDPKQFGLNRQEEEKSAGNYLAASVALGFGALLAAILQKSTHSEEAKQFIGEVVRHFDPVVQDLEVEASKRKPIPRFR